MIIYCVQEGCRCPLSVEKVEIDGRDRLLCRDGRWRACGVPGAIVLACPRCGGELPAAVTADVFGEVLHPPTAAVLELADLSVTE